MPYKTFYHLTATHLTESSGCLEREWQASRRHGMELSLASGAKSSFLSVSIVYFSSTEHFYQMLAGVNTSIDATSQSLALYDYPLVMND